MRKIADIPRYTPQFWGKLANDVVRKMKEHGAKGGKDAAGRPFKKYSDSYRSQKGAGKIRRQSSNSTKPDLMLTGDMWKDLKQIGSATKDGATIGWASWGNKVEWNAEMGRTITTDKNPVAPSIQRFILKEIDKETSKNLKKVADTTTIRVG